MNNFVITWQTGTVPRVVSRCLILSDTRLGVCGLTFSKVSLDFKFYFLCFRLLERELFVNGGRTLSCYKIIVNYYKIIPYLPFYLSWGFGTRTKERAHTVSTSLCTNMSLLTVGLSHGRPEPRALDKCTSRSQINYQERDNKSLVSGSKLVQIKEDDKQDITVDTTFFV